jgi:hypothetical protein
MSDPAWGQTNIYEDGANFTFPTFQTFDHVAGNNSQIAAPAQIPAAPTYFEIHCVAGGGQGCVGFIQTNYSGANSSVNFTNPGFVGNFDNGDIVANGTITTTGFAGAITTGTVTRYYLDGAGNYAVATGAADWNGSFTDAQIAAGTGLQPLTGLTAPFQPFVSLNSGSGTQSFAIFASSGNCTYPLISGTAYLPANAILTLSGITSVVGSPLLGTWTAANADPTDPLEISVNGDSPVATGGTNTGTGGVFTGPTVGSVGWLSAGILDPSNTLSTTPVVYSFNAPPNAGALLVSGTGTFGNVDGLSESTTLTFSAPATTVVFNATIQAIQQLDGFIFNILGNDGTTGTCEVAFDNTGVFSNPTNPISVSVPAGLTPNINTTIASSTATATGTLILDVGESITVVAYDVACNGLTASGTTTVGTITSMHSVFIEALDISLEQNEVLWHFQANGADVPETLTLSTASYNGTTEILSVGGAVNTILTSLGISTGGGFSDATSLTVSGGLYSATLAGSLSAGSYTIQTEDLTTSVVSNTLPLVVAGETLGLSTAVYNNSTEVLTVTGTVENADLTSLGISTGGSFTPATSLTVTGGYYTATLSGFLAGGTYTVQTEDFVSHVESNPLPLVVATEVLTLLTASIGSGGVLDITGSVANADLTALNISTGGSFVAAVTFSPDGGTWSATGPALPAGTYTIQAQDAVSLVLTNTLTILVPIYDCCVPLPSNTLGRYRGAVGINFYGRTLIGDAWSGVIGVANFSTFQEYGNTMRGLIAAPPLHSDRKRVFVSRFEIDVESGVGQPECCGSNPQWMLDWSKDGGRTWGPIQSFRSMGRIGQYMQRLRWLRLGQSRQWIFRLQSTDPVRRVIIGTYADFYAGMG